MISMIFSIWRNLPNIPMIFAVWRHRVPVPPQRPPPTGGGRNLDQNSWCFFSRNQQKTNTHPNRSQVIGDPQVAIGFNTKKKNKSWYHLTGAFYVGNGTGGCWDD